MGLVWELTFQPTVDDRRAAERRRRKANLHFIHRRHIDSASRHDRDRQVDVKVPKPVSRGTGAT